MRRDNLLEPDVVSEIILVGAAALGFLILLVSPCLISDSGPCAGLNLIEARAGSAVEI